jgi:hypothetical protein
MPNRVSILTYMECRSWRNRPPPRPANADRGDAGRRTIWSTPAPRELESGRMHRTRNAAAPISARMVLSCKALFYLGIFAKLSVMCRLMSSAANGLGSKMVARCSVFVRDPRASGEEIEGRVELHFRRQPPKRRASFSMPLINDSKSQVNRDCRCLNRSFAVRSPSSSYSGSSAGSYHSMIKAKSLD